MIKAISLILFFTIVNFCGAGILPSTENIRNYKEFLENSINGKSSEATIPDLTNRQNEWERSGKYQGDILLSKPQIDALVSIYSGEKNAFRIPFVLWPNATIPYEIDESYFDKEQIAAIEKGADDINRLSCISVRKRRATEEPYVRITTTENSVVLGLWYRTFGTGRIIDKYQRNYLERVLQHVQGENDGCYASLGHIWPLKDRINLAPNRPGSGCFSHGTIVHEFLHTIGFFHMQSTYDRGDWVKIIWDKIQPGAKSNFYKFPSFVIDNLGVDYDYGSVMHYSEYGFSIDGNKTIVALKQTSETIGQRIGMSASDIIRLNRLYRCNEF